ncbi:hypothetical protein DL764_002188 [Monosporascus ibericus]|uniref:Heterokaryon incompatibility domain-containing protein n=1 Tax=Monosporascus ibericus TaxID=155417 RepID=A0A4Q4TQT0_9PEZI|nr:hypothetical protein DL764_002188 [Monosporascus ibericus]
MFGHDPVFRFNSASEFLVYADANGSFRGNEDRPSLNLSYRYYMTSTTEAEPHPLCGKDGPSLLPDRVLELGEDEDEEEVKLSETAGLQERYVSLSHCCGPEQLLTTTSSTIGNRKARIPLDVLPKTFQDTVRIARGLGIRYLWVDSLCIIQDSPEDWQVQSGKMASVYLNSWLILSAMRASSAADGCFSSGQGVNVKAPDEEGEDPLAILFPEAAKLRQDLRLNLIFRLQHPDSEAGDPHDRLKHFPLLHRLRLPLRAPEVVRAAAHERYLNRDTSHELPAKIAD